MRTLGVNTEFSEGSYKERLVGVDIDPLEFEGWKIRIWGRVFITQEVLGARKMEVAQARTIPDGLSEHLNLEESKRKKVEAGVT